jgi:hypothetical protein
MDYLNPGARGLYLYENWSRTTPTLGGVCWYDMNEASVFDNDTKARTTLQTFRRPTI